MPPVILTGSIVDLSKIKMKWKETYVSEGLNRKAIPSSPRGIYSGLKLIQNITSPRQVAIAATPDSTHVAVHQSATGFSTTYHDVAGGSTILDLSSVSLDNQETVITLSIVYQVGADTTANWIAYPIADWNALTDAQRAERIVLGTVMVPAAATNITTAMILPNRRTVAWDGVSPGAVAWTPVVQNGGFEHSVDDGVYIRASSYWQLTQNVNGEWKVQSTDPYVGVRAMAFNQLVAAPPVAWIDQYIGIPVKAGQLVKYKFRVKNLKVPTGGTLTLDLLFADTSFGAFVSSSVTVPMAGIDASYRLIEGMVAAPANALQLYSVRFTNQLGQSSIGIAFRLDDVQVWVETGDALKAPSSEEQTRRPLSTESIIIESSDDPLADYYGPAALLSMPVNDELRLTRRDGDVTAGNPVQLALHTSRITRVGTDLLNTEARALLPRIEVPVSTTGGVELTLMWESRPTGQPGYRKYVSATGQLVETVNAVWGGATWSKDQVGQASVKQTLVGTSMTMHHRLAANNAAWADGAWDSLPFNLNMATPQLSLLATLAMGLNSNITLSGTGFVQGPGTLYMARHRFTAGGTYTPTAGTRRIVFKMCGAGGGGSGVGASATGGRGACGAGGASGTYVEKTIYLGGTLITGGAVAIGGGGAGGVGSNGGATGGNTSIVVQGVTYTALGGGGGVDGGSNLAPPAARRGGTFIGGSEPGDFQSADNGHAGILAGNVGDSVTLGGAGGSGRMGIGGQYSEQGPGDNAWGHGAGGGGASNWQDGSSYNGGAGTAGLVIVDDYY